MLNMTSPQFEIIFTVGLSDNFMVFAENYTPRGTENFINNLTSKYAILTFASI